MELFNTPKHLLWTAAVLIAGVVVLGCRPADSPPPLQPPAETEAKPVSEPAEEPVEGPELKAPVSPEREPAVRPESEPAVHPESESPAEPDRESEPPAEPGPEHEAMAGPDLEPEPDLPTVPESILDPDSRPPVGTEIEEPAEEKPVDLGPPLVEAPLKPLDPKRPVWLDAKNKRVVLVGQICQTEAPLELFACLKGTKEHEAIVVVDVLAQSVHAGLLAVGAEVGNPVQWEPQYKPASGTEIEVTVVWKDEKGQRKTARAQDWIQNIETKQAMTQPWVFAGSGFWQDAETGERFYQAEGGDLICVANFASAMLDVPIQSTQTDSALMFFAFTERIPPLGTPVTLVLTPKLEKPKEKENSEEP